MNITDSIICPFSETDECCGILAGLVHGDQEEPLLLIWSANASEQIGAKIKELYKIREP